MTTHNDPTTVTTTVTATAGPARTADQAPPQAAPQAARWFYWITYSFSNGNGSTECSFPAPITHGAQLLEIAQQLAQISSKPKVSVDGFALLRVEDTDGQVIS